MSEPHPVIRSGALEPFEDFVRRHVGPSDEEQSAMLKVLGYETLDALIDAAVPDSVRSLQALDLPAAMSEQEVLDELRRARVRESDRGVVDRARLPRNDHAGVIRRIVLESPACTPPIPRTVGDRPGRLEALLIPRPSCSRPGRRHRR